MATTSLSAVQWTGILAAALVVGTILVVGWLFGEEKGAKRRMWILPLLRDHDKEGLPSLAKFQLLLWTAIVSFAVLWVVFIRLSSGVDALFPQFPTNLLGIVGIGIITTPVAGHESTARYPRLLATPGLRGDRPQKPEDLKYQWRSMLLELKVVNNQVTYVPSLTRLQMLLWTLVGVTTYALVLYTFMTGAAVVAATETLSVPDLDQVFLALMGISQVGFIGGKVAGV